MLDLAINITRWLEDDRLRPISERVARDRTIGTGDASNDLEQLAHWWASIGAPGGLGERVVRARAVATTCLVLAGFTIGSTVTGVALTYDGSHPVNLLTLIGLTVALPLTLLMVNVVALATALARRPVATGLSVGYWISGWIDRMIGDSPLLRATTRRSVSRLTAWQVMTWSQWSGSAFFVGSLATTLTLVAFTDLAFGWSTTLEVESSTISAIVRVISLPWATWFPSAVPDDAVVAASRFYRVAGTEAAPGVLGQWWLFYVMTVAVYGLLPRLVWLLVSLSRTRAATPAVLMDNPEVIALLERLRTPYVASTSPGDVSDLDETGPGVPIVPPDSGGVAIVWNGALDEHLAGPDTVQLGSAMTLADEAARLESIPRDSKRVLVVTKGYEPPVGDFFDLIRRLRENVGHDVRIGVAPVEADGSVDDTNLDIWSRALARIDDARLYVTSLPT